MRDVVTRAVPHIKNDTGAGRATIDARTLLRHFDLLLSLAAGDVKVRYKQTLLGVLSVLPGVAQVCSTVIAVLIVWVGVMVDRRMERRFADVL